MIKVYNGLDRVPLRVICKNSVPPVEVLRTRDGQGFGGLRPKPVEKNKEYDVKIEEISRKGDGVAKIEGFVIFVRGGQAGQQCKIRISEVGNRFATAEIVS